MKIIIMTPEIRNKNIKRKKNHQKNLKNKIYNMWKKNNKKNQLKN